MLSGSIVTLDLHGWTVFQAQTAIDAALRRHGASAYRLRLVHGHHNGTALRGMIRARYAAHPQVLRLLPVGDGTTDLVLREL